MKHVFMDTNVVIDFLADRQPFSLHAARLFDLTIHGQVSIYISAVSYNNIYYSISKIDFIVTRDTKDFKKSTLPVLTPAEAIVALDGGL
jgi:predicted nucleic acid-binding protein